MINPYIFIINDFYDYMYYWYGPYYYVLIDDIWDYVDTEISDYWRKYAEDVLMDYIFGE